MNPFHARTMMPQTSLIKKSSVIREETVNRYQEAADMYCFCYHLCYNEGYKPIRTYPATLSGWRQPMFQHESVGLAMLRQVSLFQGFTDAQLHQVANLLHEQPYRRGEIIFQQGDPGGCLYIIGAGQVRVYLSHPDGREITLRFYEAGSHFGEFSVFDGHPRSASTIAVSDVTAFVLYRESFLDLLYANTALIQHVLAALIERLRYTTTYSENLAFLSARDRVVAMLVQLASAADTAHNSVRLDITQHDLAALANTTRETVNHTLRTLAAQNLIRSERGAVIVHNLAGLRCLISCHDGL
jgi:CRP-like cAMP-binding protein